MPQKSAAVVMIGDELLSGRTQDLNLSFIGNFLNECGIRVHEARTIPDNQQEIIQAVNELRVKYDYIFTTGGIGPTHDDVTAEAISKAFDRPLVRNKKAIELLKEYYNGADLNEARLTMADTPQGLNALIHNPLSGAPGFQVENVYVLAGVPEICRAMLRGLQEQITVGQKMLSQTLRTNLLEGTLAEKIEEIQMRHPHTEIGSYPSYTTDRFSLSLIIKGFDKDDIAIIAEELKALISDLGGKMEEMPIQ
ncbi:MAG: competence/damage-inducible protein A [Alphaproteobacteria bacterium]